MQLTSPGFDYRPQTRLVFGNGALERLGDLACELTAGPALIVTDPGIVAAGHVAHAIESLEAAGFAGRRMVRQLLLPMTAPLLPVSPDLWAREIPDGRAHRWAEDETSASLKSR